MLSKMLCRVDEIKSIELHPATREAQSLGCTLPRRGQSSMKQKRGHRHGGQSRFSRRELPKGIWTVTTLRHSMESVPPGVWATLGSALDRKARSLGVQLPLLVTTHHPVWYPALFWAQRPWKVLTKFRVGQREKMQLQGREQQCLGFWKGSGPWKCPEVGPVLHPSSLAASHLGGGVNWVTGRQVWAVGHSELSPSSEHSCM